MPEGKATERRPIPIVQINQNEQQVMVDMLRYICESIESDESFHQKLASDLQKILESDERYHVLFMKTIKRINERLSALEAEVKRLKKSRHKGESSHAEEETAKEV